MLQVYYPKFAYVIHLGTFVFSSLTQTQFSRPAFACFHSPHRFHLSQLMLCDCRRVPRWLTGTFRAGHQSFTRFLAGIALHEVFATPQYQPKGGEHQTDRLFCT